MRRLIVLAVIAGAFLFCAMLSASLVLAANDLRKGVNSISDAQSHITTASLESRPRASIQIAMVGVRSARGDFQAAESYLDPFAWLLQRLDWVPQVGGDMAAAPTAARMADDTAQGTYALLKGLQSLASTLEQRSGHGRVSVQAVLSVVSKHQPDYRSACAKLQTAWRLRPRLASFHSRRVSRGLESFNRDLPRLRALCSALELLPGLLGDGHPRTYLLAYQNPAEIRATGGFIGSAGLLTVRDGHPSQLFQGTWFGPSENTSVQPPEPIYLYNGEFGWLFRDSNWSPNFPTSAQLERFFLRLDLHRDVSSVINITPAAVAAVLQATGPIYVPEYGRRVTAANIARLADFYTHQTPDAGPYVYANQDTQRKQFIQIVGRRIFQSLSTLSTRSLIRLTRSLADAIARRDIYVYFSDAKEERLVRLIGASGEINPTKTDYLYIVDSNLAYNKVNPYVHISATYHARIRADRWLQSTLVLRFHDGPIPPRWQRYGLGPGASSMGQPDDYADFVRVYVPDGAELIDQSGWTDPWSSGPAYGKTMLCGYIIVPANHTRVVRLTYVVPPNVFTATHGRSYQLVIQKQAGGNIHNLRIQVDDERGTILTRLIPFLDMDRSLSVKIPARPFHALPLAANPMPIVAPGHLIEPHAYLQQPTPNG